MRTVAVQGVHIPAIGFGTFRCKGDAGQRAISDALEIGYRHIDTAQMYKNEAETGEAVRGSSIRREEIWVTTKIWPDRFRDGELQRAAEESARMLGTEPDLLLLHWPNPTIPLRATIGALNEVKRRGLTNHIGVSNFSVELIEQALSLTREPLLVNQVEYHPYLSQEALIAVLRKNGIALTAYSPLAKGRVFRDRTLQIIGERHGKNAGQVALRWLLQQDGVIAIPGSSRKAHATANFDIFDFELTDSEMAEISALATSWVG